MSSQSNQQYDSHKCDRNFHAGEWGGGSKTGINKLHKPCARNAKQDRLPDCKGSQKRSGKLENVGKRTKHGRDPATATTDGRPKKSGRAQTRPSRNSSSSTFHTIKRVIGIRGGLAAPRTTLKTELNHRALLPSRASLKIRKTKDASNQATIALIDRQRDQTLGRQFEIENVIFNTRSFESLRSDYRWIIEIVFRRHRIRCQNTTAHRTGIDPF